MSRLSLREIFDQHSGKVSDNSFYEQYAGK